MSKLKNIRMYLSVVILIIIDQIIKLIIINNISIKSITIINNILKFTYCENKGIAFSIGDGNVSIFIILNILIIGGLVMFYEKNKKEFNTFSKCCFIMVVAGGSSNLLDRVFRGFVVDFIDISCLFPFAIFNLADIFIVVGVFGIVLSELIKKKKEDN